MKLVKSKDQIRRDFTGVFECEGCGAKMERSGYDDTYFHQTVTPAMICKSCGASTNSMKLKSQVVATKYNADEVV